VQASTRSDHLAVETATLSEELGRGDGVLDEQWDENDSRSDDDDDDDDNDEGRLE